jgi:hypothetical protein
MSTTLCTRTGLSLFSILQLAAGCSRATTLASSAADATADAIDAAVCDGRPGCTVASQLPAGQRADGRALRVVVARLPRRRPTAAEHERVGPLAERPWDEEAQGSEAPPPPRDCVPWETWLVSQSADDARREALLASSCAPDDAERAPVVEKLGSGELRTTLTAHADNAAGKPAEGYSEMVETLDFALAPPRALRVARRFVHGLPGREPVVDSESSWDWEAFHGQACWHGHADCGALLPTAQIADDGAYAGGGWKTTALGACAMRVDATASHGVAEPAAAATASVRALLSDGVLYLEVTDDTFVTRGAVVDAIEATWTSFEAKPGARPQVERLTMDGKLTRAGGNRQVEVVDAGPSTRRFAVRDVWPPDQGWWSLSYVDTDDGVAVRQRIDSVPPGDRARTDRAARRSAAEVRAPRPRAPRRAGDAVTRVSASGPPPAPAAPRCRA